MWGLFCSECHRLLYQRKQGPISPRAVLPDVGTMYPEGTMVPRGHRMGYCTACVADTYCKEFDDATEGAEADGEGSKTPEAGQAGSPYPWTIRPLLGS